jgi:hypothetical protein
MYRAVIEKDLQPDLYVLDVESDNGIEMFLRPRGLTYNTTAISTFRLLITLDRLRGYRTLSCFDASQRTDVPFY